MKTEDFKNYAMEQGWYETILYKDITFSLPKEKTPKNFTSIVRDAFKNYYVGKESKNGRWVYTIYKGDKKIAELLHKPIKFETTRQQFNKEFKEEMNKLKHQ